MEENNRSYLCANAEEKSYFDGGYFAYFGLKLLVRFLTIISLGIAYPWLCCMLQRWKASHTVVCGKRMYFDGKGIQLIGKYLLWCLLTVVTFGIYGFWLSLSIKKWVAKHTHFEGEEDDNSYFDGNIWGFIGTKILSNLAFFVPIVGLAWRNIIRLRWYKRHTVVDSRRLFLDAAMGSLLGKYWLWGLLTVVTFGIFGFFLPVKTMRWETEHTTDHEHTTQALIRASEYRTNIHTDATAFKTFKVENDMEFVKSGITDSTDADALLALANGGNRVAQYEYAIRYASGNYAEEPFASLLKASAEAGYAPAMDLYLQAFDMDPATRAGMLRKAADLGQIRSVRELMTATAVDALSRNEDKDALPALYDAIRYADLLQDHGTALTEEESAQIKRCVLTARRIEAKYAYSSKSGKAAAVIAIVIAVPVVLALIVGAAAMFLKIPVGFNKSGDGLGGGFGSVMAPNENFADVVDFIDAQTFQSDCLDAFAAQNGYQIVAVADGMDDEGRGMTVYDVTGSGYFRMDIVRDSGNIYKVTISGDRTLAGGASEDNQAQMVLFVQHILNYMVESGDTPPVSTSSGNGSATFGCWRLWFEHNDSQLKYTLEKEY